LTESNARQDHWFQVSVNIEYLYETSSLYRKFKVGSATVPTVSDVLDDPIAAGTVARPTNSRSFFFD
jgi:hypothetical protein